MEYFILLFASILLSNCNEEANKGLTFKETFDPENTHYILNAEEEYKEIKNLKKNEIYKNSSTYSYEWSNHPSHLVISLAAYLPEGDAQGYRDMTKYDTIYFNIYSKKILPTKVALVIPCQDRTPDEISDMPYAYRSFEIEMDFEGWKEIKNHLNNWLMPMEEIFLKLKDFQFIQMDGEIFLTMKQNYIQIKYVLLS